MTRVLAELLGRTDPAFFLGLQQVERSAGRPSTDIRLSVEVQQQMRVKLRELGLDPSDTTGEELYAALGEKLQGDEERFIAALTKNVKKSADPLAHLARVLGQYLEPKQCFALKATVAKKLLKANLPKKTMKLLGYRSADSMLKHETAASLSAVAWLVEPEAWSKKHLVAYGKLKASDFEIRALSIEYPPSKRWQNLAETVVASKRHNIASQRELGTVVLLPFAEDKPAFATLVTAVLALHAVNDIYATSTYLKLHQVQPNFGAVVKQAASGDATLSASLLDEPVSWSLVQQYFARLGGAAEKQLFEPVIQAEDFAWHSVESVLAAVEPSLHFWQGTAHLAHVHDGHVVSANLTDALLSHCNGLPYAERIVQQFRHALSTELSLRYMQHGRLQESILGEVQNQLASEPALA